MRGADPAMHTLPQMECMVFASCNTVSGIGSVASILHKHAFMGYSCWLVCALGTSRFWDERNESHPMLFGGMFGVFDTLYVHE